MTWAGCVPSVPLLVLTVYCHAAMALPFQDGAGTRYREVHPSIQGKAGFTLMSPAATGVWFTNTMQGDLYATNAVAHNGSGIAIGDVDGEGGQDIYLCTLQGQNPLYRNLVYWRFEPMELGDAACLGQVSSGATFADVDG